jgi:hypothetical protein
LVTDTGYKGVPGLVTVKALGGAVVRESASLKVKVSVVPEESVVTEDQVGAAWSTVDEFATATLEKLSESFPIRSWSALFVLSFICGVGAV